MGKRNKQAGRIGNAIVNGIIEPIMKMQEENPDISALDLVNKLKERREHARTKKDILAQSVDKGVPWEILLLAVFSFFLQRNMLTN